MRRQGWKVGAVAVAFALGSLPAAAQEGSRPANGAPATGTAVPRGGDGGGGGTAVPRGGGDTGSSSGSVGGGAPTGGTGVTGGSSVGSSSISSMPSSTGAYRAAVSAPEREQSRTPRSGGGGESTGRHAVPRGGSSGGDSGSGGSRPATPSTASSSGSRESNDRADAPQRRAVPAYSRPRGDRPVTGEAVERRGVPPINGGGGIYYPVYPYYPYYPYGFWGGGYGYGLGFYDPFWYDSFGFGGFYGGGYGGGGGYSSGGYSQAYRETGSLRLKIKPSEAQVYIDGYFVGVVDNFDGAFQKLGVEGGGHRVEIKADGFEPLQFEVLITPGETVTYKGEMKRIQ